MERTFEIAAVGEYPSAVSGSNFLLPDSVLAKITGADLSDICVIPAGRRDRSDRAAGSLYEPGEPGKDERLSDHRQL